MVSVRPRIIAAILVRDTLALRWLILLAAVLTIAAGLTAWPPFPPEVIVDPNGRTLSQIAYLAAGAAGAFLIVLAMHADPAVGARHDWLTRPESRPEVVAAKCLFAIIFVLGPWLVIDIFNGLRFGYSLAEVLLEQAAGAVLALACVLAAAAVASLTESFLTLIITAAALLAILIFTLAIAATPPDLGRGVSTEHDLTAWILPAFAPPLLYVGAALVFWLGYGARKVGLARMVMIALPLAALIGIRLFGGFDVVWGMEKSAAGESAATRQIALSLPKGCFTTPPLGETTMREAEVSGYTEPFFDNPAPYLENPLHLFLPVSIANVPDGALLRIERTALSATRTDGHLRRLYTTPGYYVPDPQSTETVRSLSFSVDRKASSNATARGHRFHAAFALTLFEPLTSYNVPLDDRHHAIPGFGYCTGRRDQYDRSIARLNCLKVGAQPDLVVATLPGTDKICEACKPDFTPSELKLWGARRLTLAVNLEPGPGNAARPAAARLTTYRAAAHFDRSIDTPGPLGDAGCAADTLIEAKAPTPPAPVL